MEKYEAKAVDRMKVKLAPWEALAMAVRMKRFVRAEVERAMHVRTVKGLKRKLRGVSICSVEDCSSRTLLRQPYCSISSPSAARRTVA